MTRASEEAAGEEKRLSTLSLKSQFRFQTPEERARFAEEIRRAVVDVIARHTSPNLSRERPARARPSLPVGSDLLPPGFGHRSRGERGRGGLRDGEKASRTPARGGNADAGHARAGLRGVGRPGEDRSLVRRSRRAEKPRSARSSRGSSRSSATRFPTRSSPPSPAGDSRSAARSPKSGPFLLEVTIAREGGETVVTLVNSGFLDGSQWDEEFEGHRLGLDQRRSPFSSTTWRTIPAGRRRRSSSCNPRPSSSRICFPSTPPPRAWTAGSRRRPRSAAAARSGSLARSGFPGETV